MLKLLQILLHRTYRLMWQQMRLMDFNHLINECFNYFLVIGNALVWKIYVVKFIISLTLLLSYYLMGKGDNSYSRVGFVSCQVISIRLAIWLDSNLTCLVNMSRILDPNTICLLNKSTQHNTFNPFN